MGRALGGGPGEYLADFLAGKETLLLAGTNAEAAELARIVQSKLAAAGHAL